MTTLAILARLHADADAVDRDVLPAARAAAAERGALSDQEVSDVLADAYMPVAPAIGHLLTVLAAARRPGRIVEFGTSMGLSTIYLASALTDDEAPLVATELETAKVVAARRHIADAGMASRVELREGDALTTLAGFTDPISLLFLDGWKGLYLPVLKLLEPRLVHGALVIADDTDLLPHLCAPYVEYVRNEGNGYVTAPLNVDDGLEISVRAA
jgi:predicted O-methyltransferase YrrM